MASYRVVEWLKEGMSEECGGYASNLTTEHCRAIGVIYGTWAEYYIGVYDVYDTFFSFCISKSRYDYTKEISRQALGMEYFHTNLTTPA